MAKANVKAIWFTGRTNIGIILKDNGFEKKAYIGSVSGMNEEQDIKSILEYGNKVTLSQIKEIYEHLKE